MKKPGRKVRKSSPRERKRERDAAAAEEEEESASPPSLRARIPPSFSPFLLVSLSLSCLVCSPRCADESRIDGAWSSAGLQPSLSLPPLLVHPWPRSIIIIITFALFFSSALRCPALFCRPEKGSMSRGL